MCELVSTGFDQAIHVYLGMRTSAVSVHVACGMPVKIGYMTCGKTQMAARSGIRLVLEASATEKLNGNSPR